MHLLLLVPNHYDIQQIERVWSSPSTFGERSSVSSIPQWWPQQKLDFWWVENQAEVVANTDDCGSHPLISYHCCWLKQFRWCTYPCGLCVCVIIAGGWIASKKILWINVWTCFNPTFLDVDQIPMILTNRRFIFYSPFLLILKLPNQSGKFRYCIWQLDTPIVLWLLDFHDMHDPIDHVNLYLRIFSFWCLYQLTA